MRSEVLTAACLAASLAHSDGFMHPVAAPSSKSLTASRFTAARPAGPAGQTRGSVGGVAALSRRGRGQGGRRHSLRSLKAVLGPEVHTLVDPAWASYVYQGLADAAAVAGDGTAAVTEVAKEAVQGNDPISLCTRATEWAILGIHDQLLKLGVENPFGLSIISFTLFVKALTFPLTYTQLESTTKMQALAPKIKDLQRKYANDPEMANKAVSETYSEAGVNPLAGCLPSLAQIPIFIALYRALLNLAKADKLGEPFLWLPSLEGPVFGAEAGDSMNWLKAGWVDGAPPLGWHDTLAYLTVPVILVITQSISTKLMQPPQDPNKEPEPTQAILKFLPLMIGWFSLNVASGLGIYWIVNNFVSTGLTLFIKNKVANESGPVPEAAGGGGGGASMSMSMGDDLSSRGGGAGFGGGGTPVRDAEVRDVVPATLAEPAQGFGGGASTGVAGGESSSGAVSPQMMQGGAGDGTGAEERVIIADPSSAPTPAPKPKKKGGKKKKKRN